MRHCVIITLVPLCMCMCMCMGQLCVHSHECLPTADWYGAGKDGNKHIGLNIERIK